jgi:hypothetical protein
MINALILWLPVVEVVGIVSEMLVVVVNAPLPPTISDDENVPSSLKSIQAVNDCPLVEDGVTVAL